MFKDEYSKASYSESCKVSEAVNKESYELERHWEVTDTLYNADGKVEKRVYYNTVVDDCSKLLAGLIKGNGFKGVQYWAVGKGESSWNNDNPPNPSVSDTRLRLESFRKAIEPDNIRFLDASNNPTDEVTNKLEIKVLFTENEANGELREFALFGGNATSTANSGVMLNRKTHPLIYKTSGMRLERIIRLIL